MEWMFMVHSRSLSNAIPDLCFPPLRFPMGGGAIPLLTSYGQPSFEMPLLIYPIANMIHYT